LEEAVASLKCVITARLPAGRRFRVFRSDDPTHRRCVQLPRESSSGMWRSSRRVAGIGGAADFHGGSSTAVDLGRRIAGMTVVCRADRLRRRDVLT